MSYGLQVINGRNNIILGDGYEPYVIHDMPWVGVGDGQASWDEWGNRTGLKEGQISVPWDDAIIFFPWDGNVRGGAVYDTFYPVNGPRTKRFYVHTDAGSVRLAIAIPLTKTAGWQTQATDYGLITYNTAGLRTYDSRVPIVQTCGRFIGRGIERGNGVSFDSGNANYVSQSAVDIGIRNEIWADGFLRLTGQNSAVMAQAFTEWTDDWIGSWPLNLASNSQTSLLFARINL